LLQALGDQTPKLQIMVVAGPRNQVSLFS